MPSLTRIVLTDKLRCEGTQAVYGILYPEDLSAANDVRAVDDQESLTFRFARVDMEGDDRDITAQLRGGRVVTVHWDDDSFDEWRVAEVKQGRGNGGFVDVTCVALWLDLVERSESTDGRGWVSELVASTRNFDYEITEHTPTEIWDEFIIPNCPAWVTAGTIDPTYMIPSLSVSRLTPGALALAVRDALRAVDVPCEVRLRRNGTSGYLLDLVTEIGASAPVPLFHPSTALLTLDERADATLQATRVLVKGSTTPDGLPGQWGVARWLGGAPAGLAVALSDPNGGASPIAFDGQFVGNYLLRVKTGRTFLITDSDAAAGTVTLASVSTIAAGEFFEFRDDEPLANTVTGGSRFAISAVPDGTHITLGASVPITVDDQYVDWYAKVWSLGVGGTVIATTRISDSVAATDIITVASSAGVTNAHYVEFVQLDGAGEVPCFVEHPTYVLPDPVGYGIKVAELSRQQLGVTQLCPNSWKRTWTNPASAPDGWTHSGNMVVSQNSDPAFIQYGIYSWKFSRTDFSLDTNRFLTPRVDLAWNAGRTSLSARASIYFSTFISDAFPRYVDFSLYALQADGTLGASLGAGAKVMPVTSTDTVTKTIVSAGTWIEMKVQVKGIGPSTAPFGVVGVVTMFGGWNVVGYLDVVEVYAAEDCPNENREHGDATSLLQAGNNHLRSVATPPLYYTFTVLDLERAFPDEYARLALVLGGTVRAVDVDYGIDASVRLLKLERDLVNPAQTKLTLANRPTRLSTITSKNAVKAQRVVSAVNAGIIGGVATQPAFVALTAPATLTVDAEIQTPQATAQVVTLPLGTPTSGAAVTFVPPDPTTVPQTVVTVGRPPTRQKPIYVGDG